MCSADRPREIWAGNRKDEREMAAPGDRDRHLAAGQEGLEGRAVQLRLSRGRLENQNLAQGDPRWEILREEQRRTTLEVAAYAAGANGGY
jgi:hypothetical protein